MVKEIDHIEDWGISLVITFTFFRSWNVVGKQQFERGWEVTFTFFGPGMSWVSRNLRGDGKSHSPFFGPGMSWVSSNLRGDGKSIIYYPWQTTKILIFFMKKGRFNNKKGNQSFKLQVTKGNLKIALRHLQFED